MVMNLTSIMRRQVRSLAPLGGLRISCCHELLCRSQIQLGSHMAMAVDVAGSCSSNLAGSCSSNLAGSCSSNLTYSLEKLAGSCSSNLTCSLEKSISCRYAPPPKKTTKILGRKQFQGWSYMGNNNDILKKLKFKYCFTCKEKLSTFPNPIWTEQKYPERNQMVLLLMFSMFFRKQARAGLKAEIVLVLLL